MIQVLWESYACTRCHPAWMPRTPEGHPFPAADREAARKAVDQHLQDVHQIPSGPRLVTMTLDEAIRYLLDEAHIADYIYDVRERAVMSDPDYPGNSWDHPKVKHYAEACTALRAHIDPPPLIVRKIEP